MHTQFGLASQRIPLLNKSKVRSPVPRELELRAAWNWVCLVRTRWPTPAKSCTELAADPQGFRKPDWSIAEGCDCHGTMRYGRTLDWIFVREPAACSGTRVHRKTRASGHFPVPTMLSLTCRPEWPGPRTFLHDIDHYRTAGRKRNAGGDASSRARALSRQC